MNSHCNLQHDLVTSMLVFIITPLSFLASVQLLEYIPTAECLSQSNSALFLQMTQILS